jgi:hypothetical protein
MNNGPYTSHLGEEVNNHSIGQDLFLNYYNNFRVAEWNVLAMLSTDKLGSVLI